ncbi:type II toxin-antitoxin system death-on-curing family toxin [Candidatus Peregrinibacteria bacterium]|jgi:death on curing protein|nr:type II toxin-antitoxin system death-on-curing family toxin [Candidatus Peregrinibacteria bacterium]
MQYLSVEYILNLQKLLQDTAGGIVNLPALESTVFSIKQGYYEDPLEAAAALWKGITINHPFLDGNKRSGTLAMLDFLELNGISTNFDNEELADFAVNVAMGKYAFEEIVEIIRGNTK